MKHLKLLNAVQAKLIEFANDRGINLRDEFKTVDKFKEFVIAFTFKALTDNGIDVPEAYDIVMGDGAYVKLADDVWSKLSSSD